MKTNLEVKEMTEEDMFSTFMAVVELEAVQAAAERTTKHLETSYKKVDLEKLAMEECLHLNKQEKDLLLNSLREYETLFDGTLGDFNMSPDSLKVKENK